MFKKIVVDTNFLSSDDRVFAEVDSSISAFADMCNKLQKHYLAQTKSNENSADQKSIEFDAVEKEFLTKFENFYKFIIKKEEKLFKSSNNKRAINFTALCRVLAKSTTIFVANNARGPAMIEKLYTYYLDLIAVVLRHSSALNIEGSNTLEFKDMKIIEGTLKSRVGIDYFTLHNKQQSPQKRINAIISLLSFIKKCKSRIAIQKNTRVLQEFKAANVKELTSIYLSLGWYKAAKDTLAVLDKFLKKNKESSIIDSRSINGSNIYEQMGEAAYKAGHYQEAANYFKRPKALRSKSELASNLALRSLKVQKERCNKFRELSENITIIGGKLKLKLKSKNLFAHTKFDHHCNLEEDGTLSIDRFLDIDEKRLQRKLIELINKDKEYQKLLINAQEVPVEKTNSEGQQEALKEIVNSANETKYKLSTVDDEITTIKDKVEFDANETNNNDDINNFKSNCNNNATEDNIDFDAESEMSMTSCDTSSYDTSSYDSYGSKSNNKSESSSKFSFNKRNSTNSATSVTSETLKMPDFGEQFKNFAIFTFWNKHVPKNVLFGYINRAKISKKEKALVDISEEVLKEEMLVYGKNQTGVKPDSKRKDCYKIKVFEDKSIFSTMVAEKNGASLHEFSIIRTHNSKKFG